MCDLSNSESVRDIQFLPKSTSCFTSVSENGSVQLWDIRKGSDRPYLTFTAHSGPVFSELYKRAEFAPVLSLLVVPEYNAGDYRL